MGLQFLIIIFFFVLLGWAYYKNRSFARLPISFAFIIALSWVWYFPYKYSNANIYIPGTDINFYTFTLWFVGLSFLGILYTRLRHNPWSLFGLSVLYWATLLIVEIIGFHILGVRLMPSYPGPFGFDILHLPLYGQIFYITVGPLFLLIYKYYLRTANIDM